ncbi:MULTISPECIES: hypothetical protein [unclassified Nocardioides]|uniref:hypothetical protein n=1 Tax=unclassified Nocardioides TaxID=2615069 RepID=UPI000056FA4D|nr:MULTISPECIES: hypothetical protein [unclassified Nocardioides]ABL80661.1 hypothetical protein Noca_1145 [Nocardioides sp. JS614]
MRSPRLTLAVTALATALALSACSGSGSDDGSGTKADPSDTAAPESQADCEATVKLTGDVKASWSGPGYVITGGGNQAFYKTSQGKKSVSIIPGRGDEPATPIVAAGGTTFTVQPGEGEVDVDPDGGGAEVDADATATKKGKNVTLHLVASFDC